MCSKVCGDGLKAAEENCDDGGLGNLDGCSSLCTIEHGYYCTGNNPSTCVSNCGDGLIASNE